jgi:predicted permease
MHHFIYHIKQAWSSLKGQPGFVGAVVSTMGVTLGALLCVLTLAHLLLFKPLPYPDQEQLFKVVHVMGDATGEHDTQWYTYPGLMHLYNNQDVFSDTALLNYRQEVMTSEAHQPVLYTAYATPEWFSLLNTQTHLGRLFEQTESVDAFNPVAILSYATWQNEFSADPDILSKNVTFRGVSYSVVGVLAADFIEPNIQLRGNNTGVWLPWDFNAEVRFKNLWYGITELVFVGKLKSGLSVASVEQQLTPLVNDKWQENVQAIPFFKGWSIDMQLRSFKSVILGDIQNTLYLLLAGMLGLVSIASANLCNLFVSRTAQQGFNLAIRSAIGAKPSHLFYHLLAEIGLLMLLSILLSLVISSSGFYLLQHFLGQTFPRLDELENNLVTFGLACLFMLLFTLFFAFLCSRMIQYRRLIKSMQGASKGVSVQVSRGMRQTLVMAQVAIATLLVFANIGLFNQAFDSIQQSNDFDLQDLTHLTFVPATAKQHSAAQIGVSMQDIGKSLKNLPQVEEVTHSSSALGYFKKWAITHAVTDDRYVVSSKEVDHQYFDMYGQKLVEGRQFNQADVLDGNNVLLVNQTFANQLSPIGSALGTRFTADGRQPATVIGVVEDLNMPGESEIPIRVYQTTSVYSTDMTLRVKPKQSLSRQQVVDMLVNISSEYVLFSFEPLTTSQYKLLFTQYITVFTTSVVALITLFLAGLGLYGILSYSAQIRRFELGTRLALGAKGKDLIRLIFTDNASMILLGILSSVLVILGLYLGFSHMFSAIIGKDLMTPLVLSILSIVALCLFACYWPLRRYIRQPVVYSLRGSD